MASSTELQNKAPLSDTFQKNEPDDLEYVKEYVHVILLAIVFCVFVSVITYNPADPSSFNISSVASQNHAQVTNTFGLLGASVADWGFQIFGLGSIVFTMVFIIQLLNTFKRPKQKSRFALRLFGYPQLIICYLGLLSLVTTEFHFRGIYIYTGGVIGHSISQFFVSFAGKTGAFISLSFGMIASLTLALGIRPITSGAYLLSLIPFKFAKKMAGAISDQGIEKEMAQHNAESALKKPHDLTSHKINQKKDENIFEESENFVASILGEKKILNLNNNINQIESYVSQTDFDKLLACLEYHKNLSSKKNVELEQQKLKEEAKLIEEKFATFGVKGFVTRSLNGPVINLHEFEPASGVKVNKVLSLQDDLSLALKAQSVLIGLQPGKSSLGIELPAHNRETVSLREIMESEVFLNKNMSLPVALGKNIEGTPLISDLAAMPHLLVAGATGAGKSVCINAMLISLMVSKTPKQLRLLLVDPKMLELSVYDGIGHLLMPVVTEPDKAAGALKWAIEEMERRYRLMKNYQVRNIMAFNNAILNGEFKQTDLGLQKVDILPHIVVVVDELSDLMMTSPKDVEDSIQRLAQKARAAGIHLILATQRPSVDVLTGVIKANLPCRLSFQVASRHDSRTVIESIGAERLLGKGDMLFLPPGVNKVIRAQCAFVTDKEIAATVKELKSLYPQTYETHIIQEIERASLDLRQKNDKSTESITLSLSNDNETIDENTLYDRAVEFAKEIGSVSTSSIQREFRIGYNRAARLMDRMILEGIVGQAESSGKPRPVLKRF